MKRLITAAAIACLSLAALGSAQAAPKTAQAAAEKVCVRGQGKYVCCKAGVADHCIYVSCCEVGNAGFFTATDCQTCASHVMERAMHAGACADCETASGNAAFYTDGGANSAGGRSAHLIKSATAAHAAK